MIIKRFSGEIAGAVAREIERIAADETYAASEGAAYKGAWDRLGSPAERHIEAFTWDCMTAGMVASFHGYPITKMYLMAAGFRVCLAP